MIELVRFKERMPALFLQQVLQEQGIDCALQQGSGDFAVLLAEADDYQRARLLVDEVAADPYSPRFQAAAQRAAAQDGAGRRQGVLATAQGQKVGPLTRVVLVLCVAIFVIGGLQSPALFELFPLLQGSQIPEVYQWLMPPLSTDMLAAQPWRLFTPVLIHFGLMHIIFNLLWWWIFGGLIERHHSVHTLLMVTVVTGLAGNAVQYQVGGPGFGGLSGVVYGLFGFLWFAGWTSGRPEYLMPRSVTLWLIGWLVLSAVTMPDLIATAAHIGGLVAGCLYGGVVGTWLRQRPPGPRD